MGIIRNYLEVRLDRYSEPEAVNKDLPEDIENYSEKDIYVRRSIWSFYSIHDAYLLTPVHSRVYMGFMIHIRRSESKKTVFFSYFFSLLPFSPPTLPILDLATR